MSDKEKHIIHHSVELDDIYIIPLEDEVEEIPEQKEETK